MFVISLTLATYAPNVDKDMTIHYYVRSREQDEQLGLLEVSKTVAFHLPLSFAMSFSKLLAAIYPRI